MKIALIISIVVVLLIAVGVSYSILNRPSLPAAPPPVTPPTEPPALTEQTAPPTESKPLPEPPLSFEQKTGSLKKAIADVCATGESKKITLIFTETEVNDQAAALLSQVEIPADIPLAMESVQVDLQPDNNLVTEIGTHTYGLSVTIKVKAQLGVAEGKPEVQVTKVSFGFVPLPGSLKDSIAGLITQTIDDLLNQLTGREIACNEREIDVEFTDISTQPDKIIMTVVIKPKM